MDIQSDPTVLCGSLEQTVVKTPAVLVHTTFFIERSQINQCERVVDERLL